MTPPKVGMNEDGPLKCGHRVERGERFVAEGRNERGRILEGSAARQSGISRRRSGPAGPTARNPLGPTPSRSLDRLPNPLSSPARAFCATSTRVSIEMTPTGPAGMFRPP